MKLIIAGSRDIDDYDLLVAEIVKSGIWKQYKRDIEVVCGMAKGVDMLGYEFAKRNSLAIHEFPANWDLYGKSAGHRRNKEMGDFADQLLALWDGKSRGTKGMIEYMEYLGKPCHVWKPEGVL